ncbi:MAG: lysine exporter LysO family protein [Paraprevotella sp.]|nr:lysine exporter LysO family protein [Paraprevotella sp.]
MFRILLLLLLGMGAGVLMRKIPSVRKVEQTTRYTILAMLFVFGTSIGANHSLLSRIAYFGWQAFVIAILGVIGSFGAAYLFHYLSQKKRKEADDEE